MFLEEWLQEIITGIYIKPSLVISAIHKDVFKKNKPISLISNKDIRWKYSNIKSTSLLGNVLLKQKALKKILLSVLCMMIKK